MVIPKCSFVGRDIVDGGFENGLVGWLVGCSSDPLTATLVYTTTTLESDVVGGIVITSPAGSGSVQRRVAKWPDLAPPPRITRMATPSASLAAADVYVSPTGVTQLSFWYRLLSFDVKVGSEQHGYKEYDPFELFINGTRLWDDGYDWSYEWQDWKVGPPTPEVPQDMGWQQGVLDLTPYAGQMVTLEFRVPNRSVAADNTWVYIDDIVVVNQEIPVDKVYIPVIIR
jgi:hypothetical protein